MRLTSPSFRPLAVGVHHHGALSLGLNNPGSKHQQQQEQQSRWQNGTCAEIDEEIDGEIEVVRAAEECCEKSVEVEVDVDVTGCGGSGSRSGSVLMNGGGGGASSSDDNHNHMSALFFNEEDLPPPGSVRHSECRNDDNDGYGRETSGGRSFAFEVRDVAPALSSPGVVSPPRWNAVVTPDAGGGGNDEHDEGSPPDGLLSDVLGASPRSYQYYGGYDDDENENDDGSLPSMRDAESLLSDVLGDSIVSPTEYRVSDILTPKIPTTPGSGTMIIPITFNGQAEDDAAPPGVQTDGTDTTAHDRYAAIAPDERSVYCGGYDDDEDENDDGSLPSMRDAESLLSDVLGDSIVSPTIPTSPGSGTMIVPIICNGQTKDDAAPPGVQADGTDATIHDRYAAVMLRARRIRDAKDLYVDTTPRITSASVRPTSAPQNITALLSSSDARSTSTSTRRLLLDPSIEIESQHWPETFDDLTHRILCQKRGQAILKKRLQTELDEMTLKSSGLEAELEHLVRSKKYVERAHEKLTLEKAEAHGRQQERDREINNIRLERIGIENRHRLEMAALEEERCRKLEFLRNEKACAVEDAERDATNARRGLQSALEALADERERIGIEVQRLTDETNNAKEAGRRTLEEFEMQKNKQASEARDEAARLEAEIIEAEECRKVRKTQLETEKERINAAVKRGQNEIANTKKTMESAVKSLRDYKEKMESDMNDEMINLARSAKERERALRDRLDGMEKVRKEGDDMLEQKLRQSERAVRTIEHRIADLKSDSENNSEGEEESYLEASGLDKCGPLAILGEVSKIAVDMIMQPFDDEKLVRTAKSKR